MSDICEKCGQPLAVAKCGTCGGEISILSHEVYGTWYHKECEPPPTPGSMRIFNNTILWRCPKDETEAAQ
jgi:hypothetical protein